jgi:GT2 family glycosyltransferase
MTATAVTVVIVNWNSGTLLEECLARLAQQTLLPSRVLVMDNGSTDGSAQRAQLIPGVTVRMLGVNLGFAAANNVALGECDTDVVALLNPDAFPEADWLMHLVTAARTYPDVAAFGSRQMMSGFPAVLDGIGDIYHFSGRVWREGHGRSKCAADHIASEIFSPCAGAALYRRDALVSVGGFDEDYFCYVEDIDLGFRLRLAGHACLYVPDAIVHHVGSASSGGQHSDFSVYYGHRNLVWTFVKNMPGALFWLLLPLHVLLNLSTIIWITAARRQGKVILHAKWDALKGLPKTWAKRKHIQTSRVATIREIWRILDKRSSFRKKS